MERHKKKYRAYATNGDIYELLADNHNDALIRILRLRNKHQNPNILRVEIRTPRAKWVECQKVGI